MPTTSTETMSGDSSNNASRSSKCSRRKTLLETLGLKTVDDDSIISLVNRICLHEEEEYLKLKAGWVDTCHESPTMPNDYIMDSGKVPVGRTSLPSPSSSSSSEKAEAEDKVLFGDITRLLEICTKLPEPLLRAQTIYCSRISLTQYNLKHGTDYKLVEPLFSGRAVDRGIGFHCNFTAAKLKKDNTPGKPELFYANFRCLNTKVYGIQCCILDPAKAIHNCHVGCPSELGHCPCNRHPQDSYYGRRAKPEDIACQDLYCAKTALKWYNKQYDTAYKLVKPMDSNVTVDYGQTRRFHCNFTARLRNACSPEDASPRHFFGEFVRFSKILSVNCCIVDVAEALELDYRCWFCPRGGGILHPPDYRGRTRPLPPGSVDTNE